MKSLKIIFLLFCVRLLSAQSPFLLPKLSYDYTALEPSIDAMTMEIHHSKHHATYIKNLNLALEGRPYQSLSLIDLLKSVSKYPEAIRNNAGGHYNHSLFWTILTPEKNTKPSVQLERAIVGQYGSLDSLKRLITKKASSQFGSGWVWLIVNANGELQVTTTANQDNPLMDVVDLKGFPIFCIDVWEHAYYLKYQNKRGDYLGQIWNVVNWNEVSRLYKESMPKIADWQSFTGLKSTIQRLSDPKLNYLTTASTLKMFILEPAPKSFQSLNLKELVNKSQTLVGMLENKKKLKKELLLLQQKELLDLILKVEAEN